MHTWLCEVEKTVVERTLFRDGQSILVAVSAGVDSVVLLHVLHHLAPAHKWRLAVAHFNHGLRGKESDGDERFTRRLAKRLGWPVIVGRGDARSAQHAGKISLEMAARKMRHEFFGNAARDLKINTVALAHHADDQVELFFLRLFRGAGAEGLGGMRWIGPALYHEGVDLVRPLLDQTRDSIHDFAETHRIYFREDSSNASVDILRNRVRRHLIPVLRREFGASSLKMILRSMQVIAANGQHLAAAADAWLRSPTPFPELSCALQRQCLRIQLEQLHVKAGFELIEQLRYNPDRKISINQGHTVRRDCTGRVYQQEVSMAAFSDATGIALDLTRSGDQQFDQVRLAWKSQDVKKAGAFPLPRKGIEYFDADKVGAWGTVRHWRRGDRFRPIGMTSDVKLQDLFTNAKVKKDERQLRLVACAADGRVFWVEGLRIGECFKLDKGTVRRLKWRWLRPRGAIAAQG